MNPLSFSIKLILGIYKERPSSLITRCLADVVQSLERTHNERAQEDFLGILSPFDSLSKPTFSSSGISIDTYKLLLLPIWKIAFCLRDERSIVLVNGQTGTVAESALSG
jgi:hypothetical protein